MLTKSPGGGSITRMCRRVHQLCVSKLRTNGVRGAGRGKMRAVLCNGACSWLRKLVTDASASSFSFQSVSRYLTAIRHAEKYRASPI